MRETAERDWGPYGSPVALADERVADVDTGVPMDALRAFVGPNSEHYLRKWAPRLLDPRHDVGVSWIAFFFPSLWLAYRKMFAAGLAVWCVNFGITVASASLFPLSSLSYTGMALALRLVLAIVCCVSANGWYLNHALRSIAKARAQGYEDEHLYLVLSGRGGTSGLQLAAMFVVIGALSLAGRMALLGYAAG